MTKGGFEREILVPEEGMALRAMDKGCLSARQLSKFISRELVAVEDQASRWYQVILDEKLHWAARMVVQILRVDSLAVVEKRAGVG